MSEKVAIQASVKSLSELLEVPSAYRDPNWEVEFFYQIIRSKINLVENKPVEGPDGMPYMIGETGDSATEPVAPLIDWLNENGIGLVINPKETYPDYVFTWGMIWNFKKNGQFVIPLDNVSKGEFELAEGKAVHTEKLGDNLIPDYVRKMLREFFAQQKVETVRVMTMLVPGQIHADVCFSLESLGNPPQVEHDGICQAISWFMPPHYPIVLMSEKDFTTFCDL